jgi:RNA exonuclease 4
MASPSRRYGEWCSEKQSTTLPRPREPHAHSSTLALCHLIVLFSPGKYLALDCEMVGVGIDGNESSLARVSIVNYTGAIILDVFVRQREKVVDYRTQWSGVRGTDLAGSGMCVAANECIPRGTDCADMVIHSRAIQTSPTNGGRPDQGPNPRWSCYIQRSQGACTTHTRYFSYNLVRIQALLLSHPSPQLRDTQSLAYKHRVVKSRRPALRVLVKQELDIVIQGGEHSSVSCPFPLDDGVVCLTSIG